MESGESTWGVQSDEVICLLASSSFDSVPSLATRCHSHTCVVLCKARSRMLVSSTGGFSWVRLPVLVMNLGRQSLQSLVVNVAVTGLSPSLARVRNLCLCFPAYSGFSRVSTLPNVVQF